jgi:mRNA interferase HicA
MTGKEMTKVPRVHVWGMDRISGSHYSLVKGERTITVPVHGKKDLKKGLQQAFLNEGGIK